MKRNISALGKNRNVTIDSVRSFKDVSPAKKPKSEKKDKKKTKKPSPLQPVKTHARSKSPVKKVAF